MTSLADAEWHARRGRVARKHRSDTYRAASARSNHTAVVRGATVSDVTGTYHLDAAVPAWHAVVPRFSPKVFPSAVAVVADVQRDMLRTALRPPSLFKWGRELDDQIETMLTERACEQIAAHAACRQVAADDRDRRGVDLARLSAKLHAALGAIVRAITPPAPVVAALAGPVEAPHPPGRTMTSTPAVTRGPTDRLSRLVHGGAWPVQLRAPGAPALS